MMIPPNPRINTDTSIHTPQHIQDCAWGMLGQSAQAIRTQIGHRDLFAEVIRNNYLYALDIVLLELPWHFPIEQKKLVFYADEIGGAVRPCDLLKIIAVGECLDCCDVLIDSGWDERNCRIYPCCGAGSCCCACACSCGVFIRYVARHERFCDWHPLAIEMLILKLAELSCAQVIQDRSHTVAPRLTKSYEDVKIRAIGINGRKRRIGR